MLRINLYNIFLVVLISIYIVLAVIYHLVIPIIMFFSILFIGINRLCIRKPNEKEWEFLRELECWHYTSFENSQKIDRKDGNVYLKRSRNPFVNTTLLFRPAIYFFYMPPSESIKKNNLWGKDSNVKVIVKIGDMKKEYVRLRKFDNTLVYLKEDYLGPGKIERE